MFVRAIFLVMLSVLYICTKSWLLGQGHLLYTLCKEPGGREFQNLRHGRNRIEEMTRRKKCFFFLKEYTFEKLLFFLLENKLCDNKRNIKILNSQCFLIYFYYYYHFQFRLDIRFCKGKALFPIVKATSLREIEKFVPKLVKQSEIQYCYC